MRSVSNRFLTRVRQGEGRVEQLERRVEALESRTAEAGWSPSPLVDINIKLLGDSNYSGKVKFGSERGTLGSALPGNSQFCAKIGDLPTSEELTDCSDIVLAVGTNDLKASDSDPTTCAQSLYTKINEYRRDLPNTRIVLPGVLPTSDIVVNKRIKTFNKHLVDICNSRVINMVNFVDTRVFCDNEGKLRGKFRRENDGNMNLHLNPEGTKLLASRLKTTLRECHRLPTGPRFRTRYHNQEGNFQSTSGRGRGRGNSSARRGGSRGYGAPRGAANNNS